jgi:glucose/arabinose dehydrogenase
MRFLQSDAMDRHCLHAKFRLLSIFALVLAYSQAIVSAQSCPNLSSGNPAPVLAAGWEARLVATGLSTPRGIIFDGQGNLLVVEGGTGVTGLAFSDGGGTCLTLTSQTSVIKSTNVGLMHRGHFSKYGID